MKINRPEPLILNIRGVDYTVAAITRAQVRAAAALDPMDPASETAAQADERKARQLRIFLGGGSGAEAWTMKWWIGRCYLMIGREVPGEIPLAKLTSDEEGEILYAVYARHLGWDPAEAVAGRRLLKKKGLVEMLATLASDASTPTPASSPPNSAAGSP